MTTREDIKKWLEHAFEGATHMLVVCDAFEYEDYPVYTDTPHEDVEKYNNASMQRVMEVYDLDKDFEIQLDQYRVWNL